MDPIEEIMLQDCPLCGGGALLEEENHSGFAVSCLDCGCHTVVIDFRREEEKLEAAKRAAALWNYGKVLSSDPGE